MTPLPQRLEPAHQLGMWDDEPEMFGTALFSPCSLYRYELTRKWGDGGRVNFIMLNPSTAGAIEPDPTVTRCINFAKDWGFGGLVVTNLYAFRSTDPNVMKLAADPIGPDNDEIIKTNVAECGLVVCAWGNNATTGRAAHVLTLIRDAGKVPHALRMTSLRHPSHPLYLPSNLKPQPMEAL